MKSAKPKVLRILAASIAAVAFAWISLLAWNWPWTAERLRSALEKQTGAQITFGSFHTTYFPPGCVIGNIRVSLAGTPEGPPLFTATSAAVRARYSNLLRGRRIVDELIFTGMHVSVPPKTATRSLHSQNPGSDHTLLITRIEADDAILDFLPADHDAQATTLKIRQLRLDNAAKNEPLTFHALLGIGSASIHSVGRIGPWKTGELARTPATGFYTMEHADLAFLKGVSGLVSTQGKFTGDLGALRLQGTADVPSFCVIHSSHPVHLSSRYSLLTSIITGAGAILDAQVHWNSTTLQASGKWMNRPDERGQTLYLNTSVQQGRLEDLLMLFTSRPEPAMRGNLEMQAHIVLPPTPPKFLQRIEITGEFRSPQNRFTSLHTQSVIDKLDQSASGKPKSDIAPPLALSEISGHVSARNGVASLSHISLTSAGSTVQVRGTFDLISKTVDLHGLLETEGRLADTATGFRAMLVKVIAPIWKHRHHKSIVPFHITGTSHAPHVSIEMKRTDHL